VCPDIHHRVCPDIHHPVCPDIQKGIALFERLQGGSTLPSEKDSINTLRTGSFKLFKRPFPGFLTILTL
jgi:hypothetical protein